MWLDEKCPFCEKGHISLLSTLNEWKYFCEFCHVRFNEKREKLEESDG